MPFTLATWNINSVRLREPIVLKLLAEHGPDVLCLQECKSPVDKIPTAAFIEAGYTHMVARGQKGYNGVAILSRLPLVDAGDQDFATLGHARHVAAKLENGVTVHNFYVPAGGDVPDREVNEKFGQKLDYLADMRDWFHGDKPEKSILVGDLNIAPREDDVWDHKKLLKVVSHTPIEVEKLAETAGGPTAPRIGMRQTRAAGWITSGQRPISRARHIPAACCATPVVGKSPATTRRSLRHSTFEIDRRALI